MIKETENFLSKLVKPHPKVSREVLESDIERVVKEANILYNLCFTKNGLTSGAYAMASPQIDDQDPLRFFVTARKDLIINPVIVRHTKHTVPSKEGCYSFPERQPIIVQRWHKIEVEFRTLIVDPDNKDKYKFSSLLKENLSGKEAKIWTHEIDHLFARYVYL